MAHHWRKPERPAPVQKKPSVLTELVTLFWSSFGITGDHRNQWAMPFSVSSMAFRRPFSGRKQT